MITSEFEKIVPEDTKQFKALFKRYRDKKLEDLDELYYISNNALILAQRWCEIQSIASVIAKENGISKTDCTAEYIFDKAELVDWLLSQKDISQNSLLKHLANKQIKGLTWNYVEDKKYPAAPVTSLLTNIIREAGDTPSGSYHTGRNHGRTD